MSTSKLATFAVLAIVCIATMDPATAQTITSYSLDGATYAPVVQGFDGNLYGVGVDWGKNGGAVFRMTTTGTLTTLHTFCLHAGCSDGENPVGGLLLASNGNFYGTTELGGANNNTTVCSTYGCGTVFEITPGGKLTTLYNFCSQASCTDGAFPTGTLVQGVDGSLYGTTQFGGANCANCGTIFKINSAGQFATLYSFCSQSNCADGVQPYSGLVLAKNGNLYGTTIAGGIGYTGSLYSGAGTLFGVTPTGTLTTIHSFCSATKCLDGSNPYAGLIQGSDGKLYGGNLWSGLHNNGNLFRISLTGNLTVIHQFCIKTADCPDGAQPSGAMIQASDGNFYGTTQMGGTEFNGTAFELTPEGAYTNLYSFCPTGFCNEGVNPEAQMLQATNGVFYGTTLAGGTSSKCNGSCGTVFSLPTGLGPFVTANPVFGKVGRTINILGNGLTGTTSVTFNGVSTTFAVVSDTRVVADVPAGATDGTIEVTTPAGTLSSNISFHVIP